MNLIRSSGLGGDSRIFGQMEVIKISPIFCFNNILSYLGLQEVFHVFLNKFEIAVSHLFHIIFSNDKFTLVS